MQDTVLSNPGPHPATKMTPITAQWKYVAKISNPPTDCPGSDAEQLHQLSNQNAAGMLLTKNRYYQNYCSKINSAAPE